MYLIATYDCEKCGQPIDETVYYVPERVGKCCLNEEKDVVSSYIYLGVLFSRDLDSEKFVRIKQR